ncbi:MAG: hypothetical protein WA659_01495 [Candidatus Aquirickettsiella sp.]
MNIDYLDQLIPKRWILLLHYWLPFFNTPSNFYFKCRAFIDNLKRSGYEYFSWQKFPDLLFILEKYTRNSAEKNIAREIILAIFTREYKKITLKLLISIFSKFNPDNENTPFLNEVLQRIPAKLYNEYFSTLNHTHCPALHLKWCARLKDKFLLEDKLCLILSLSDESLTANQSTIFQLAVQECEDKLLIRKFGLNNFLNAYVIEQLLKFILYRNPRIIFSSIFIHTLINQLLKNQNPILTSYILELDEHARYNFFENFLINSQNFQENSRYFFSLCPEEQWSNMIDQLITSVFNAHESEMHDETLNEKNLIVENAILLLTQLQEQYDTYSVNLFQFLAIQSLTKNPLGLATLKKVFTANHGSLEHYKNFSVACQVAVAESSILAIKVYIKDNFMIYVRKENTRHDIHRSFYQFFNNEYIGKPLNVAKLILKKLPEHLQSQSETDLNLLQQLLSQLYLIIENPTLVAYKTSRIIAWNKKQREYEEKNEARRELLQRIRDGKQSSIAYQCMEEIFGSEAQTIQENLKKTLGVHFFDANDKEEYKIALHEAAEIIKFNHEHNDFSSLSSSPLSTNYFAFNF